jgi:hypothetical protein
MEEQAPKDGTFATDTMSLMFDALAVDMIECVANSSEAGAAPKLHIAVPPAHT